MKIYLIGTNTISFANDIDFSDLKAFGELRLFPCLSADEVIESCADADILLVNKTDLSARVLRRFHLWRGRPLPQARLDAYRWLAQACSRLLRHTDTDLIVPQSLLPYLWMAGELAGRRFDVLMTALPPGDPRRAGLNCPVLTKPFDETEFAVALAGIND